MTTQFAIDPDHPITKLDPTNQMHRRIARLLSYGMTCEAIADHIDITEITARQYARDPRTLQMIAHLDVLKRQQNLVDRDDFDELQSEAIKVYEKALADKNLSIEAKVRVANQILDRHPEGTFVKAQKNKIEGGQVIANEAINELKRRSHMAAAEVIDITPSSHTPAVPPQPISPAQGADSVSPAESAPAPIEVSE